MDFDEYDYLEKAVEEPETRNNGSKKDTGEEKIRTSSRTSRRREEDEDDSRTKKLRSDNENGDRIKEYDSSSRSRDKDRDRHHRSSRDVDRERDRGGRGDRDKERVREKERDKEKVRERDREREKREREKESEREKEREREKEKEKERERSRRSSSHSRRHLSVDRDVDKEVLRARSRDREAMEREQEMERETRRFKDNKKETEPEADPERDQRTVFAYQMPLKAAERDVYEFFSKAGKVRDVRLIMDRNSRRSKGVGYVEFYDALSVPMAIALSGHHLMGQPVMVKPSEAEKNLVQSTVAGGGAGVLSGPYGAVARKLYVGNLHFNMTEEQLRQVFEPFGPVELVQLPLDLESGLCKGFGFVQFAQLEHAKAAQSLNGKLEIAGRIIKVSAVTDHLGIQPTGANAADFDDDDGGGLSLNAQSRAMLMQKLDRTGIATSIAGSLGVPVLNGAAPNALPVQTMGFPGVVPLAPPTSIFSPPVAEIPIGIPSVCLLLTNMFDPATEDDPEFDLDIKEEVQEECSQYGPVKHCYVDKHSEGHVYLRFETVAAAAAAQRAMHMRWFARRRIVAIFMQPHEYEAKFPGL